MTDQLETLEDCVNTIPDTTITKGDVSVSWDGLEYTYRAFGREIDRDEALALIKALETEENRGGSRLFRLAASTPKAEGVIYAKAEGERVRWYRHMDIHNRMEFYGLNEASLFTIEEVKNHIKTVQGYTDQGGWISAVWPELASPDPIAIVPEGAKAIVTDPKRSDASHIERLTPPELPSDVHALITEAERMIADIGTYRPIHPRTPADTFAAGPKPIKDLGPDPSAVFLAAKDYAETFTPAGEDVGRLIYIAFCAGAKWQADRVREAIK